ncbi:MAG: hypothetical protein UX99_C0003G0057 [Candidatus Amesbacteria bacterium GW2011_GWB1_47_26]|uniref:Uncharacterized protein n=1 Tax=Candidatus Amesbacteria bacterium GW2011_GWC2_45_19 TaxID=1618366 RepID=A0A0G1PCT0_9BACT|nr:MAG: hypothetical protein UX05_C0003G0057 [Candidatus Amesbacteria bacterium GW2011_GWC2_45_19]KKU38677.1 MAG: hypothetical protein UX52_C0002G0057 [Candidatus Amesbacteria bacterium GW2011_GWA1_46_35]KKU68619.1 MAG: hypothetical protein UX93_C0006G0036 [Microgenomates group bacterium GW2011_GWC1_47_20]KKU74997.1 MAG: hypothetical protein UX99_C0003G0057 [Candidatus Amesbacteria bacterium GW2011_GWB1_47_26]
MAKVKKVRIETVKFKPGKRDILTEMFEHFGIKVIDVSNQNSKPNKIENI